MRGGGELTKEEVKIYSLYDENYFEVLSINSFELALSTWLNFIQLKPEAGLEQEIEV